MSQNYFLPAAKRLAVDVEYGKGVYLYDKSGKAYLDCLSGMGVNALGHQHPKIMEAINKQAHKNLHLFGYFIQDVHYQMAEMFIKHTNFPRIFFCNSGTEATEGTLKLVKKWGNTRNKTEIVCFFGGFHGRSLGALSITAQPKKQAPYLPLLPNVISIDKTVDELDKYINEKTLCVNLELITGEGGIVPTSQEFVNKLVDLRNKFGFVIIVDEIQSGMGRTGKLFSYMHYNFEPDLVTVAKGIGGGLPLGAILMTEELAHVFGEGEHGSTFGGNPMCVALGNVVLDELFNNGLMDHVNSMSIFCKTELTKLQNKYPKIIKDIRIFGLMIGIEVGDIAADMMKKSLEKGMIVNATQGHTIRLLPPLIITEIELSKAFKIFDEILETYNFK